jgi:NTP pyrophosphatase (non-canonical NTP hydrolase)
MVREFMVKNNQAYEKKPTTNIPPAVQVLRLRLMMEELGELAGAMHEGNIVLIADGLADLDYVVTGTAIAYGIPHEVVFREVHRSNMTKAALDPNNKGGKVSKAGYEPPKISEILEKLA